MAKTDHDYSAILDIAALKAECEAAAVFHKGHLLDTRAALLPILKKATADGREAARQKLFEDGSGLACARRISWLQDQMITVVYDIVTTQIFPEKQSTIAVTAVGGYGRGTLAPGSDIDLLFLLPQKIEGAMQKSVEFMLYLLWDIGFKVGHATRTIEECIRLSKTDMTIRTAILEARFICGRKLLVDDLEHRFDTEVTASSAPEFIAAKLAERDERHRKSGDTRYLVEPNVKEGKGGLRDLHTLFWIAKYYYHIRDSA